MADAEVFAEFVATCSRRLLRTAYLLTHDHGHAEDLLQTALARCWLAWSRITGDPERYAHKVMVNTYATWWRRRWRGELPAVSVPELPDPDAAAEVDERERVWQALGRLPRRQQAVIVLRFYEDLPVEEVADVLGCSTGTVKSQTSKALARLRVDSALDEVGPRTEGTPA